MARPNGKSVRLSDQALAIVNDAPGEGFNDKFEKLIFAYANTIPTRLAQLAALDKQIDQKKKQLDSLRSMEQKVNYMVRQLGDIAELIPSISKTLDSVSHEARQASTGLKSNEIHDYEQLSYTGNVHEEDFPDDDGF